MGKIIVKVESRTPVAFRFDIEVPKMGLLNKHIFIDRVALAKQGDNVLGSVRLSVSVRSHG